MAWKTIGNFQIGQEDGLSLCRIVEMRRLTFSASLKETCSDFLRDILKNPPGGDSRLDMEDVMKTSSRRHRLTVVQLCYNCNSFILFNGNLAHKEPNYSQKPVTDQDAF